MPLTEDRDVPVLIAGRDIDIDHREGIHLLRVLAIGGEDEDRSAREQVRRKRDAQGEGDGPAARRSGLQETSSRAWV